MTTNTFESFFNQMIINSAQKIFAAETYIDDHDGKEYGMPNVIGFQIRGMKVTPVYVSEKYSFSINPFMFRKQDDKWHLDTCSCGGTVIAKGDLQKSIRHFNNEHSYKDEYNGWSKEYIILVRKEGDKIIIEW